RHEEKNSMERPCFTCASSGASVRTGSMRMDTIRRDGMTEHTRFEEHRRQSVLQRAQCLRGYIEGFSMGNNSPKGRLGKSSFPRNRYLAYENVRNKREWPGSGKSHLHPLSKQTVTIRSGE